MTDGRSDRKNNAVSEETDIVQAISAGNPEFTTPMVYLRPFGPEEYQGRLKRIRDEMIRLDITAALISDPKTVWWLAAGKAKFEYADNPIWLIVPHDGDGPVTAVVRHLERGTFERSVSEVVEDLVEDLVEDKDGGLLIPYDPVPVVARDGVSLFAAVPLVPSAIGLTLSMGHVPKTFTEGR